VVKKYSVKTINCSIVVALSSFLTGTIFVKPSFAMLTSENEKYSGQNLFPKKQRQPNKINCLKPETGKTSRVLAEKNQLKHQKSDLRKDAINKTKKSNNKTNKENIENSFFMLPDKLHDNNFFDSQDVMKSLKCLSLEEISYKRKTLDNSRYENNTESNTKKPKYSNQDIYDPLSDESSITEFPIDLGAPTAIYSLESDINFPENNNFIASNVNTNHSTQNDKNSVVIVDNWKNREDQIAPSMVTSVAPQTQCFDQQLLQWQLDQDQYYKAQQSHSKTVHELQLRNAPQWYCQQILYYAPQFYQQQYQVYYAPPDYNQKCHQQQNESYYATQGYQQQNRPYYAQQFYQQQRHNWQFHSLFQVPQKKVLKEKKSTPKFEVLPLLFPELQGNPNFQTDPKLQEQFLQKLGQQPRQKKNRTRK
jgi:hypothetical protein